MGDDEIFIGIQKQLEQNLNDYSPILDKMFIFYTEFLRSYSDSMQKSIDSAQPYLIETDFMYFHEIAKKDSLKQVRIQLFTYK